MFAVEVALEGDPLVSLMSQMRLWLDQRRIEPSSFRYVGGSPATMVRVGFKTESEALAFAEHFGGPLRRIAQTELLVAS
jgi:hypothetical protein